VLGLRQRGDVGSDVVAASVIAATDQDITHAGCAHFAEGDFLLIGRHGKRFVV
jgi:hypothetical protein